MNDENIIYCDTDSLYLSTNQLLTEENKKDREFCKKYTAKFCQDVSEYINNSYFELTTDIFNTKEHFLNIEADACSETVLWTGKKKYAMNLFCELSKNKWYDSPKLKVIGLDTKRSSFPKLFKELMEKIISKILNKEDNNAVNILIEEYKKIVKTCDYVDLSKNTAVKEISKYEQRDRTPFNTKFIKKTPSHVKAAISYNDFIKFKNLTKTCELITDGEKIKCLYLKDNPYKLEVLAFRNDGKDPKELIEYIEKYIDRNKTYASEIENKIESFYNAMKWKLKSDNEDKFNEFFS